MFHSQISTRFVIHLWNSFAFYIAVVGSFKRNKGPQSFTQNDTGAVSDVSLCGPRGQWGQAEHLLLSMLQMKMYISSSTILEMQELYWEIYQHEIYLFMYKALLIVTLWAL